MKKIISAATLFCGLMFASDNAFSDSTIAHTSTVTTTVTDMMDNKDNPMLIENFWFKHDVLMDTNKTTMLRDHELFMMNTAENCEMMINSNGTIVMKHKGVVYVTDKNKNIIKDPKIVNKMIDSMASMKKDMMDMDESKMEGYSTKTADEMNEMMNTMKMLKDKMMDAKTYMLEAR